MSSNRIGDVDSLFLQNLISRLQLRQPNPNLLPRSLDDLLVDVISNLDKNRGEDKDDAEDNSGGSYKLKLAKEESKLEKELIRLIRNGDTQTLKPNSGQAVRIGEHHICVGNRVENGSDYRVWEWHGHVIMFDVENGYTPEYIYGNYFERMPTKSKKDANKKEDVPDKVEEAEEEKPLNLGLKELIGGVNSGVVRVVHRGLNNAR